MKTSLNPRSVSICLLHDLPTHDWWCFLFAFQIKLFQGPVTETCMIKVLKRESWWTESHVQVEHKWWIFIELDYYRAPNRLPPPLPSPLSPQPSHTEIQTFFFSPLSSTTTPSSTLVCLIIIGAFSTLFSFPPPKPSETQSFWQILDKQIFISQLLRKVQNLRIRYLGQIRSFERTKHFIIYWGYLKIR